jgi:hypothetical protein
MAKVPLPKPFEDLLDVNIKPGRRNIYLYMTEPEGDFWLKHILFAN